MDDLTRPSCRRRERVENVHHGERKKLWSSILRARIFSLLNFFYESKIILTLFHHFLSISRVRQILFGSRYCLNSAGKEQ
jgi:hypothetical protein